MAGEVNWRTLLGGPIMVLDVESVGLHGPAFAFGYTVVDPTRGWDVLGELRYACDPTGLPGTQRDLMWALVHVWGRHKTWSPMLRPEGWRKDAVATCPAELADTFWSAWLWWREHGAILAADHPFPVETNFLSRCVQARSPLDDWKGPYPLHDVSSVCHAAGLLDGDVERLPAVELPEHDPLADARHSARKLRLALERLRPPA